MAGGRGENWFKLQTMLHLESKDIKSWAVLHDGMSASTASTFYDTHRYSQCDKFHVSSRLGFQNFYGPSSKNRPVET